MNPHDVERECWACGLSVRTCSTTHMQVLSADGEILLNVWPTVDKYLSAKAPQKAKARRGGLPEVVAAARAIATRRGVKEPAAACDTPQAEPTGRLGAIEARLAALEQRVAQLEAREP